MDAYERWAGQAQYDLDTARAMQKSGRYLYVLFCCQQAVEKMLKAVIARNTSEAPPRVHQLVRLAEVAVLSLSEEQQEFLRDLSAYYIQTRYPEEIPALASKVTKQQARRVILKVEETIAWLRSIQ